MRDSSITVMLPYTDGNQALTPDESEVLDAVPRNMLVSRSAVSKAIGFEKTKTVRNLKSWWKRVIFAPRARVAQGAAPGLHCRPVK